MRGGPPWAGGWGGPPPPGFGAGPGGWRGPGGRKRRGDVRVALLGLLADEPMHGYQMIRELEERSGGTWRPSPGSVYPTLQLLEDEGLVATDVEGERRTYRLTDAGRAEVERLGDGARPWEAHAEAASSPRHRLFHAMMEVGAAVHAVGASGSPNQVDAAIDVLADARRRVYELLAEGTSPGDDPLPDDEEDGSGPGREA